MYKAVLFDLDGTLLDRDASLFQFVPDQYDRLKPHVAHIEKDTFVSRFIALDAHGYVWKDRVYMQLIEEFAITSISMPALLEDYITQFQHHCIAFPYVHEMLRELKAQGMKLDIITNGYTAFQWHTIRALQLHPYFDVIVVSEAVNMWKPDAAIFEHALQKLGVQPEESIFFGDHLDNDVRAAKRVRMASIWKNTAASHADADAVIECYDGFIPLLQTIWAKQRT